MKIKTWKETPEEKKKRAKKIIALLTKAYPEAKCSLDHKNPLQLLVATILSAQCTDKRVNLVTPALFARFKTAKAFAEASLPELEKQVRTTGFYRNKAKSLKGLGQALLEKHGGGVPKTMEELIHLPGVGRKTANVVLGTGYGIASGVVVDTHVSRIAARLGLSPESNPEKMEKHLMEVIPKKDWILFPHQIIHHGRAVCKAQRPNCPGCVLNKLCPSSTV
ncbi:MAG TPA: endonuclease III [candidate division Zixibacteria bacterium]|nr:endonuclease III [candidate division Zixibacteria bacterium]